MAAALCLAPGRVLYGQSPTPPAPADPKVVVGWISREPRFPPPATLDTPAGEGWPTPGDTVRWVGHVVNRSASPVPGVSYTWRVDGVDVSRGTVDATAGTSEIVLRWPWTSTRSHVTLAIAAAAPSAGAAREEDAVTVATDALSGGFWVEQALYDWMTQGGRPGFEPWLQRQVESWNAILARAVFSSAPEGAHDRIRVDRVVVLPDGGRPRNEEIDTDVHWTFLARPSIAGFLRVGAPASLVDDQAIVLHEMLHQRGLVDLYAYRVLNGDDRTGSSVAISEDGRPVAGTMLMPAVRGLPTLLYGTPLRGLMGSDYTKAASLSEHCVTGLNHVAGRRTPRWLDRWGNLVVGFSNAVWPGSSTLRMPSRTGIRLVDGDGRALPAARVDVYLDQSQETYQNRHPGGPSHTLTAGDDGVVELPRDLLATSPVAAGLPKAQVLILGVRTAGGRGYAFLPAHDLNVLYFREPSRGVLTLPVSLVSW